jgi:hypothetical protein
MDSARKLRLSSIAHDPPPPTTHTSNSNPFSYLQQFDRLSHQHQHQHQHRVDDSDVHLGLTPVSHALACHLLQNALIPVVDDISIRRPFHYSAAHRGRQIQDHPSLPVFASAATTVPMLLAGGSGGGGLSPPNHDLPSLSYHQQLQSHLWMASAARDAAVAVAATSHHHQHQHQRQRQQQYQQLQHNPFATAIVSASLPYEHFHHRTTTATSTQHGQELEQSIRDHTRNLLRLQEYERRAAIAVVAAAATPTTTSSIPSQSLSNVATFTTTTTAPSPPSPPPPDAIASILATFGRSDGDGSVYRPQRQRQQRAVPPKEFEKEDEDRTLLVTTGTTTKQKSYYSSGTPLSTSLQQQQQQQPKAVHDCVVDCSNNDANIGGDDDNENEKDDKLMDSDVKIGTNHCNVDDGGAGGGTCTWKDVPQKKNSKCGMEYSSVATKRKKDDADMDHTVGKHRRQQRQRRRGLLKVGDDDITSSSLVPTHESNNTSKSTMGDSICPKNQLPPTRIPKPTVECRKDSQNAIPIKGTNNVVPDAVQSTHERLDLINSNDEDNIFGRRNKALKLARSLPFDKKYYVLGRLFEDMSQGQKEDIRKLLEQV